MAGALVLCSSGPVHAVPYLYIPGAVPFYMERPTVKASFALERGRESTSDAKGERELDLTQSREELDIRTRGFVYHPSLVVYELGLRPQFRQYSITGDNGYDRSTDTNFLGYLIDTTWLRDKPYTVELYAASSRNDVSNSLSQNTVSESSVYRGVLNLKYPVLPTRVTAQSNHVVTRGFYRTVDDLDYLRIDSRNETENSRSFMNAYAGTTDRTINGTSFSTDVVSVIGSNDWRISDKNRLFSNLGYNKTSSEDRDSAVTRVQSRLEVQHRPKFATRYSVNLQRNSGTGYSSDAYVLGAGLNHQLYENLNTDFQVNSNRTSTSDGDLAIDGAALELRYTRTIPGGRLGLNLGARDTISDDQRTGDVVQIRDESHTFKGTATEIFLDNRNVDTASIVVTNFDGSISYVEGIDYFVDTVGVSTRISRDPVAGIGDNETVLVDYSYQPDAPAKTELRNYHYGINLFLWNKLTLYYSNYRANEEQLAGDYPVPLIDDTVHRYGLELEWGWSRTELTVEDLDTSISPMKRFIARETLTFKPGRRVRFMLRGEYNESELKDTAEVTKTSAVEADLTWYVGRTGQLRARAYGRRTTSSVQDSVRRGVFAVYDWWWGSWRPRLRYEFWRDNNDQAETERNRHWILFQIERNFY